MSAALSDDNPLLTKAAVLAALDRYHAALDVKLAGWLQSLGFALDGGD